MYFKSNHELWHAQSSLLQSYTAKMANRSAPVQQNTPGTSGIIDKKRIQDLVKEVDPMEQLDEDVEEVYSTEGFIYMVISLNWQEPKLQNGAVVSTDWYYTKHSEELSRRVRYYQLLHDMEWGVIRVATAGGIWKSFFPDRENTGNLLKNI